MRVLYLDKHKLPLKLRNDLKHCNIVLKLQWLYGDEEIKQKERNRRIL